MKTKISYLFIMSFLLIFNSCSNDDETTPTPPVATANPTTQTINSGESTSISLSSTLSGTEFAWTVVQSGVSGATAGSGSSINQMLTTTGATVGTAVYSIIPTKDGVTGTAISLTVTVNPIVAKATYNSDIKPLLTVSCAPCHVSGGGNPNKWDNYATTKSKIVTILDRVQRSPGTSGYMPQGGTALTQAQIDLLKKWVTDGLLEN